jgi:hypothetical protein
MNGRILSVMEKQAGFGASINILSDKISLLMGLISDQKISEATEDTTTKMRRPSPDASPSFTPYNTMNDLSVSEPSTLVVAQIPALGNAQEITIRERNGSVSMKLIASKSSSSTESGNLRSPEKKRQRPGLNNTASDASQIDDPRLDDAASITTAINCQARQADDHEEPPTQNSLDDITTALESRYNSIQDSPGDSSAL